MIRNFHRENDPSFHIHIQILGVNCECMSFIIKYQCNLRTICLIWVNVVMLSWQYCDNIYISQICNIVTILWYHSFFKIGHDLQYTIMEILPEYCDIIINLAQDSPRNVEVHTILWRDLLLAGALCKDTKVSLQNFLRLFIDVCDTKFRTICKNIITSA